MHNGIVKNYSELKREIEKECHKLVTDTGTVFRCGGPNSGWTYAGDLYQSVRRDRRYAGRTARSKVERSQNDGYL